MNKKITNIICIPLKIILILCISYGLYSYFDEVFETKGIERAESFHNLPENSLDVLVLGSSHAQFSFVPSIYYQDTGLYSIVMGSACQPLEVSYQMLREVLKTQNPSLVILETYTAMPLREVCEADSCYVTAHYMMTGEEKYNTLNYLPEDKAKSYYNEFINNHNNWKYLNSLKDLNCYSKNTDTIDIDYNMGYVEKEPDLPVENYWYANSYEETIDVELDERDLESLNNIYDLCKENGIQLMLYKTPVDNIDLLNHSYLNKVWEWCDSKNIPYENIIDLQDKIDFRMFSHSDSNHCNIIGANTITEELANFSKNNFEFNHKDNEFLNNIYIKDGTYKALHVYEFEKNVYKALRRIKHSDVTLLVKYEPGLLMEDRLKETLIDLGCSKTMDLQKSYYAIIKNGILISESFGEPMTINVNNHKVEINQKDIFIDNSNLNVQGQLGLVAAKNDLNEYYLKNININGYPWELGYDYFLKIS